MKVRAHLLIAGRVQGVFFRATARERARSLGVNGWVKNRWDGRVELVAEGEKEKVEELIRWAHKGPPGAWVEKVEVKWEEYQGEFETFSIRY